MHRLRPPTFVFLALLFFAVTALPAAGETTVRLGDDPALSADGKQLAFSFAGDVWIVSSHGGNASRVSTHPAEESQPKFSPDSRSLAFVSKRSGSPQVWVQSLDDEGRVAGTPRQVTHHTAGCRFEGWYPDGEHLLISGSRDEYWYPRENVRFYRVAANERKAEQLLFNAYGSAPSLSPDGKSLLFQREGVVWWRKGYRGTQAAQIWRFDADDDSFTEVLSDAVGHRTPIWKPDNSGFYFVSMRSGSFNLWEQDFESDEPRQLTQHEDDSVVLPALSHDGATLVYRHRFDFYRLDLKEADAKPQRIEIRITGEPVSEPTLRRSVTSAGEASFTPDGLEIAVAAGGDIWVMDTELKEPVNVTRSATDESEPVFIEDGKALLFLRDSEGGVNLWRAEREIESQFWWRQERFHLRQLTRLPGTLSNVQLSPDGSKIGFVRKPGDLYVADLDGRNERLIVSGFDSPSYDFSPDGRYVAYAQKDNDFNSDIWIVPSDRSAEPVNVSRHPKNDYSPKWSPDGRILAFTGVRDEENTDILYVYLKREDADTTSRDRTLEQAVKKIEDARKNPSGKSESSAEKESDKDKAKPSGDAKESPDADKKEKSDKPKDDPKPVEIDFEDIHERVERIRISNSSVRGLFWFGDEAKLGFQATIDGRSGTYMVEFPDKKTPKFLTSEQGSFATRLKDGKRIGWINSGNPGTLGSDGKVTRYGFSARQEINANERFRAGFDVAWRLMRDNWYDDRYGNRNWDAIRRKYTDVAASSPDLPTLTTVIQMMLGELNGSHLGFSPRGGSSYSPDGWVPQTAHLGVRFDRDYRGPGIKIRDVLVGGPADRVQSRLHPGEVILSIDSVAVDPDVDLTEVLNGELSRDIELRVRSAAPSEEDEEKAEATDSSAKASRAVERTVIIRPISYSVAQKLLYPMWLEANRKKVDEWSQGRFGYLHIQGMNMPSLYEFERQLFHVGYGKDGLVIDVRANGGGSTADRLLTALTQPRHAITVPRGGTPGYPQDRTVYATWSKPIIVLCNQNSFSNAEIFSHAIRVLKRGRLVGVQTAGGVISTGAASVMDLGTIRQPYRGWFGVDSGEDMELNGAKPHVQIWALPGEMSEGKDRVLERAVKMLEQDVKKYKRRPQPKLTRATERE